MTRVLTGSNCITDGEIRSLRELALRLGASDARAVASALIRVEDRLADLCREPRCNQYGTSGNGPPRISGPEGFRAVRAACPVALAVRIEVPVDILRSDDRREVLVVLHEMVARIERAAIEMGYTRSAAFAGGCCKALFCEDRPECRVLAGGRCRHPDSARPSMSGFGVDVGHLMTSAGWSDDLGAAAGSAPAGGTSWVAGLVLIG